MLDSNYQFCIYNNKQPQEINSGRYTGWTNRNLLCLLRHTLEILMPKSVGILEYNLLDYVCHK